MTNKPCFAVCPYSAWEKNGQRHENPAVNLNHVQRIKRGRDDGHPLIAAYLIVFSFTNGEQATWQFKDKDVRDAEYHKVVKQCS